MTKLTRTIALALLTLPQVLQAGSLVECQNEHRVIYSSPDPNRIDRFHGTDPPNFNEGTHLISGKGLTPFQVVPFVF